MVSQNVRFLLGHPVYLQSAVAYDSLLKQNQSHPTALTCVSLHIAQY